MRSLASLRRVLAVTPAANVQHGATPCGDLGCEPCQDVAWPAGSWESLLAADPEGLEHVSARDAAAVAHAMTALPPPPRVPVDMRPTVRPGRGS